MGRVTRRDGRWKMASLNYGDSVWAALEATRNLDGFPDAKGHDYELRILTVPSLGLEAFWLRSLDESVEDVVIPFEGPKARENGRGMQVETLPNYLAWVRQKALTLVSGR